MYTAAGQSVQGLVGSSITILGTVVRILNGAVFQIHRIVRIASYDNQGIQCVIIFIAINDDFSAAGCFAVDIKLGIATDQIDELVIMCRMSNDVAGAGRAVIHRNTQLCTCRHSDHTVQGESDACAARLAQDDPNRALHRQVAHMGHILVNVVCIAIDKR